MAGDPAYARRLLDDYEAGDITYAALVAQAKDVIGEAAWPSGHPKKSVVIGLLKRAAEAEAIQE